ncbi:hypothetical protein N7520_008808 [Penicillium odoratum]|uniref:uncharacterized protein n=1 Tax=Penicillium odoratum TaxID=1167516 RepID=UPI0025483845|nr:uncharacterized protein N7520_008808 [Penicillium odoratum]KAJ5751891.1 hypothetical protein N7520_008808 [Penicillium odoratum]
MNYKTENEHREDVEEPVSETAEGEGNTWPPRGLDTRTILVLLAMNLISFTQILNLVGSAAFSTEIAEVVGQADTSVWLNQAVAILTCVLGPPVSQAADYWGRKWFIVILTLLGVIGSIIVSRATFMGMAIAGEVVGGLSYGAQPLLYAVSSEIVARRYRPLAQAGMNITLALAGLFALLVGSTLIQDNPAGFRNYWYIIAAIQAASAGICVILYNPPPRPLQLSLSTRQKLEALDWIGYALLASGIVLFCIALTWSQNPYTWTDAHILAPFILGVVILIAFGLHQAFLKDDGMLHHDLFRNRNFALAILCIFIEGMVFFAANNFFPMEAGILLQAGTFQAGLRFCICFCTAIASSVGIAIYSSFTKTLRGPTIMSFICFAIFNILMATLTPSNKTALWGYPVLLGLGLGICLTCIIALAQFSTPPHLIALASGLMVGARSLGGSVALAIYTSIFNSELTQHLAKDIANKVIPLGLPESELGSFITALTSNNQTQLLEMSNVTGQIIEAGVSGLQSGYTSAFRFVWVTAGALSLVGIVAAWFLRNPQNEFSLEVDAPIVSRETHCDESVHSA